ncbi:MAG: PIG-L family deacetylase [Candidatus Dormibacteraeota bacterium]|nr:PIG-L family deacetylase [Candidatus Dormibacteraeota bacterium]
MGNGTAILRHVAAGTEVHLVCATKGGAGWNGLPAGRRQEELPEIRAAELERAAAVLGLSSVEVWDYPDGGVPGCDLAEITSRIRAAVERIDPDLVYGWGPDGGYGHPDHIAVGACTDAALRGSRKELFHLVFDKAEAAFMNAYVRRIDPAGSMAFAPVDRPDLTFEPTSQELADVRQAVYCHASQLSPVWREWVDDDASFYWLARNSYLRVDDSRSL